MKRILLAFTAALLSATSVIPGIAGGGPGGLAPDTPLSSPNVHIMNTIPDAGSVGGRFIGRYFYTTTLTGLRIYDVGDPLLPTLVGAVALPVWENEDVDVSQERNIALISVDSNDSSQPGVLYVIDVVNPALPKIAGVLRYPKGGPGHIANCIVGCNYAYITGGTKLMVIDLRTITAPKYMGEVATPSGDANASFDPGKIHDVNVDPYGNVWTTGSGGTTEYAPITDPMHPTKIALTTKTDNDATDAFIHHNSIRLDANTVLVTEENWLQPQCGSQGRFETWSLPATTGGNLKPIAQWRTELGDYLNGGAAATVTCSSHWFTLNPNHVVAAGWYNQGVRFLDVSNPKTIRQVGYWIGPNTMASAGLFVPGHPDIAYVPDYERGLDIVKIDRGGAGAPTVQAPIRPSWIAATPAFAFKPSQSRGTMCYIP